jgi:hypothetical protein
MNWTDRLPGPMQTTVILVTAVAYVVGLAIGAIALVFLLAALLHLVWASVMGG